MCHIFKLRNLTKLLYIKQCQKLGSDGGRKFMKCYLPRKQKIQSAVNFYPLNYPILAKTKNQILLSCEYM